MLNIYRDVEIQLKLSSTTGMGSVAPRVAVKMTAPPFTSSVMSRTNGPRQQDVSFDASSKTIIWTIKDFPGSAQAHSYLRVSNVFLRIRAFFSTFCGHLAYIALSYTQYTHYILSIRYFKR